MWNETDVPGQAGRHAVVTGANTGIGYETARVLAARGARVTLACRDAARGKRAAERIRAAAPGSTVDVLRLDLGGLASVRDAAAALRERTDRVDLLVNNAGITGVDGRSTDGFQAQFAVNHLGHFAFTALIADLITGVPGARVVTVSSIGHRFGSLSDVDADRGAYARSKLANLLFTFALQRRLSGAGSPAASLAAHPGGASTEIFRNAHPAFRAPNLLIARLFGRTPEMGALPTLRAATDPSARGGAYYGPGGLFEIAGYPVEVTASTKARDTVEQERLWTMSEKMTGIRFGV